MTTREKPRVALEQWVRRGPKSARRRIKCEFDSRDLVWNVEVHTEESDVYIHVRNAEFHAAMERALTLVREGEAHRRRVRRGRSASAANRSKRTSRRNGRLRYGHSPQAAYDRAQDAYEGAVAAAERRGSDPEGDWRVMQAKSRMLESRLALRANSMRRTSRRAA